MHHGHDFHSPWLSDHEFLSACDRDAPLQAIDTDIHKSSSPDLLGTMMPKSPNGCTTDTEADASELSLVDRAAITSHG